MLDDDIQFDTDQQAAAYWRSTAHDLRANLPLHMAKLTGYGSDTQLEDTNAALEEFQQSSRGPSPLGPDHARIFTWSAQSWRRSWRRTPNDRSS
jgi:hypothetical protein